VLCGAGTAGLYQAGVLRALNEAGVKIDLLAGQGAGVVTALFGSVDGGARLWDAAGPWTSSRLRAAYRWRRALRVAGLGLAAAGLLIVSPIAVLGFAALVYALSLLAGLASLPNVSLWLVEAYRRSLEILFQPPILPTVLPRLVVLAGVVVLGVLVWAAVQAARGDRGRRRWRGGVWWRLVGSPLEAEEPDGAMVEALWHLVRGAAAGPQPGPDDIARRYVETLTDNAGQPGFRELLIGVHDLDARRDLIGVILPADWHTRFGARRPSAGPREAEVVDFTGPDRGRLVDFLRAGLRLPAVMAPHVAEFSADGYWRGEAHRLCDRPELVARLIEEISAAGIEQVVLVSPAAPPAVPHGMRSTPLDFRTRMGELLRSIETAALQDAWSAAVPRFSGVFVIRPDHNPIGPFDFAGAYDEASDRTRKPDELLAQGYQDAYRQFIGPVVAAGEKIEAI
jgi:hypothetical protein